MVPDLVTVGGLTVDNIIAAENAALERLATIVADQIVARLALYARDAKPRP